MSWDFFILRYVEVLKEIYLEIKSFPEIMYDVQMLLKGILKQAFWSKYTNMNIWFLQIC